MPDAYQRCSYELAEARGYALGNDCQNQPWFSLIDEVRKDRRELAAAHKRILELESLIVAMTCR
jgi:hypothetical protein